MRDWEEKLTQLGYGLVAFALVVGIVILLVDRAPKRGRERVQLAAFIGPALFMLAVGLVIPAIRTIILSFKDARGGWCEWVPSRIAARAGPGSRCTRPRSRRTTWRRPTRTPRCPAWWLRPSAWRPH